VPKGEKRNSSGSEVKWGTDHKEERPHPLLIKHHFPGYFTPGFRSGGTSRSTRRPGIRFTGTEANEIGLGAQAYTHKKQKEGLEQFWIRQPNARAEKKEKLWI
jgi:hypothetical protein